MRLSVVLGLCTILTASCGGDDSARSGSTGGSAPAGSGGASSAGSSGASETGAMAYRHRLVDATFEGVAKRGFDGVMQMVTKDGSDRTTIKQICTGLGATGNVADYYAHSRADNDPHGVGAFVLMWEGMQ